MTTKLKTCHRCGRKTLPAKICSACGAVLNKFWWHVEFVGKISAAIGITLATVMYLAVDSGLWRWMTWKDEIEVVFWSSIGDEQTYLIANHGDGSIYIESVEIGNSVNESFSTRVINRIIEPKTHISINPEFDSFPILFHVSKSLPISERKMLYEGLWGVDKLYENCLNKEYLSKSHPHYRQMKTNQETTRNNHFDRIEISKATLKYETLHDRKDHELELQVVGVITIDETLCEKHHHRINQPHFVLAKQYVKYLRENGRHEEADNVEKPLLNIKRSFIQSRTHEEPRN